MSRRNVCLTTLLVAGALTASCSGDNSGERAGSDALCGAPEVRTVVERLGERLKQVSLLAPDSIVVGEIRRSYESLVTPELLARWTSTPRSAPGRNVSSPWPERIEIRSVEDVGAGACRVDGEVIYATSADSVAARMPVTLEVREADGWRIGAYDAASSAADTVGADQADSAQGGATQGGAAQAAEVIRRYYAAIGARDYRRAYELWSEGGAASGQTLEEFTAGFARTARTEATIGEPGRIEGAAGSRYVEVPVVVRAVTDAGEEQRFEGTYVLRRSVVDGATAEQRLWHIHSADIMSSM